MSLILYLSTRKLRLESWAVPTCLEALVALPPFLPPGTPLAAHTSLGTLPARAGAPPELCPQPCGGLGWGPRGLSLGAAPCEQQNRCLCLPRYV